jgi:hypothetical protein
MNFSDKRALNFLGVDGFKTISEKRVADHL